MLLHIRKFACLLGAFATTVFSFASTTAAQGRFEPAIQVNDVIITSYELEQRIQFLTLLNAPGDPADLAREQLVTAAIQTRAASSVGVVVPEEAIAAGIDNFASQANLTGEQFIQVLEQNGIGPETIRSFVSTGLAWRDYVRGRFAGEARDLPTSLVARELTRTGTEGGTRVLLTEIVLPAGTDETRSASTQRAAELQEIGDAFEFASAARRFSIAPSRAGGGERPWVAVEALPEEVSAAINGLDVGRSSRPIDVQDTIRLYFIRDRETVPAGTPESLNVDYALYIASDKADAELTKQRIDTCDDLYGLAIGKPENRLTREALPSQELPSDIRTALFSLDTNETTVIERGTQTAVVMLCGRTIEAESDIDFELVGTRLLNERLTALASHHLEELRASAVIQDYTN